MLTIKTVEDIKIGSRITFWNGIYAIFLGALYLIFIKILLKMNFRVIDVVWQVFAKYNPGINALLFRLIIFKAILIIIFGAVIILLSLYILRKKDKTAWAVLFFLGLIFWASLLAMEIFNKNIYTIIVCFVGLLSFIIGMLLPIRYYLERRYEDY